MKKILGYIFITIGIVFTFLLVTFLITRVTDVNIPDGTTAYSAGYIFGTALVYGLAIIVIIVLIKKGARWVK